MKLVYFTSKTFPASTADHFFVLQTSRAFTSLLGDDFLLVVGDERNDQLDGIPHYSFGLKMIRAKRLFIFFQSLYLIYSRKLCTKDTVFFTNDHSLLRMLFFWKKIFRFSYRVVSDWHMLFGEKNEAKIIEKSDCVITTTKHLKNLISRRFGAHEDKIHAVYGGVDLDIVEKNTDTPEELRKRLNLPIHDFLAGYVGYYKTMGMSKGLDTMIEALTFIPDESVKMVFVGGNSLEIPEYTQFARERGVLHRITFIPISPPETLALYERAMDALIIPYPDQPHFREHGFPMKTYEYLASKKPVIYSDLPIIAEVLSDCAVSFNPGNAKDLAEKILEIKNHPEHAKELVVRGYEKASDCTWKKRAEKIIAFIKEI